MPQLSFVENDVFFSKIRCVSGIVLCPNPDNNLLHDEVYINSKCIDGERDDVAVQQETFQVVLVPCILTILLLLHGCVLDPSPLPSIPLSADGSIPWLILETMQR